MALASALFVGIVLPLTACSDNKPAAPASGTSAAKPAEEAEAPLPPSEVETNLPPAVRDSIQKPYTGDLDGMVKRRIVRIGVTFNRTFYFVDKGVQRAAARSPSPFAGTARSCPRP